MRFSGPLKENYMFRRLYNRGASTANAYLVLYARRNNSSRNRVGITVSGKLGHAVQRNKIRRRLREIYRLHESEFKPGWDLVVVARTRAMDAEFSKLQQAYLALAGKMHLLQEERTPS